VKEIFATRTSTQRRLSSQIDSRDVSAASAAVLGASGKVGVLTVDGSIANLEAGGLGGAPDIQGVQHRLFFLFLLFGLLGSSVLLNPSLAVLDAVHQEGIELLSCKSDAFSAVGDAERRGSGRERWECAAGLFFHVSVSCSPPYRDGLQLLHVY